MNNDAAFLRDRVRQLEASLARVTANECHRKYEEKKLRQRAEAAERERDELLRLKLNEASVLKWNDGAIRRIEQERDTLARQLEQAHKFMRFALLWCDRGPPHAGPGQEATALDAIRHHPVLSKLRRAALDAGKEASDA